ELSALFTRIAGVKARIVAALSGSVAASGGKPAEHGTMVGSMQQFYGKVRAAFGDTNYGYVAELEESEDRLLGHFLAHRRRQIVVLQHILERAQQA
uniref:PA2169 family four-helix-bundle protein n=1 Tax=Enterobacter hormaechei TaxID=158836 RepID=UPI00203C3382